MKILNKGYYNFSLRSLAVFIIVFTFVISGCKKGWLEAKSDAKQDVPATVKAFQAMLDNIGLNTFAIYVNQIASDGHYYTDNEYNLVPASGLYVKNAYAWEEVHSYIDLNGYLNQYSNPYNSILSMNVILDQAKKSKDTDHAGLDQVKGQALFHRGRLFFELAQTFAPPYKATSASSDLGIALRLNTDITEPSVRSSIKQTYDQIISDLMTAKEILPDVPDFLTRASKPAALGMLAKVYLSIGDYENAFIYANEYLKNKSDLLDYSTLSPSATFIGVNQEIAFVSFQGLSYLTSRYLIDQGLYDSYSQNDLRKSIFFNSVAAGIVFKGHYTKSATSVFVGIATDEMYLIRAEGYARKGNLIAAMKDLNDLLKTRWKKVGGISTYIDQIAPDETDALRKIFNERNKQLILRNVRWTDLRRLNQDSRFAVTLTRTIGGQTYTIEPESYKYTFPIPSEVIQQSNMPQNPGWK